MAEEIKLKTPVFIVGTMAEVAAIEVGDNDLVATTDELYYNADETDAKIADTVGEVAAELDALNGESI